MEYKQCNYTEQLISCQDSCQDLAAPTLVPNQLGQKKKRIFLKCELDWDTHQKYIEWKLWNLHSDSQGNLVWPPIFSWHHPHISYCVSSSVPQPVALLYTLQIHSAFSLLRRLSYWILAQHEITHMAALYCPTFLKFHLDWHLVNVCLSLFYLQPQKMHLNFSFTTPRSCLMIQWRITS